MVGWVNASGLAKLTASADTVGLRVRILGCYTFRPESVVAVKRLVWIPLFTSVSESNIASRVIQKQIIFWYFGGPDALLSRIQAVGFVPKAAPSATPIRRGIAIRWQAILVAVVVWNGLFRLGQRYLPFSPAQLAFPLLALALLFAVSFTAPRNDALQRMIISRGRNVGEIRPLLNLLAFLSGLLFIVFGALTVFQLRQ